MNRNESGSIQIDLKKRETLKWMRNGLIGFAALALAGGAMRLSPIIDEMGNWGEANLPVEEYLKINAPNLKRLHFGANLIPDYGLIPSNADPAKVIAELKNLGCEQIRLATRWNTYENYGIKPYAQYISESLDNGIDLIISYGAKSPGWPETHFPQHIEERLPEMNVHDGATITADSELGNRTLEYSSSLLDSLDQEFGLESFWGFNPENEHYENFGIHSLNVGKTLLIKQVDLLHEKIKSTNILMNTIGITRPGNRPSLAVNAERAIEIAKMYPDMKMGVGADVYEESDYGRISADFYVDTLAAADILYGDELIPSTLNSLFRNNIGVEVTEFQIHEWVKEQRKHEPGSRIHTQYLLSRVGERLMNNDYFSSENRLLVRLWGMEPFLLKMQDDKTYTSSNELLQLVSQINSGNFL